MEAPTPTEYLTYILDNLKSRGSENVDVHWRPQHLSCPFCLLQFSVYARVEDMAEDTTYFFLKAGLKDRFNKSKINTSDYNKGSLLKSSLTLKPFFRIDISKKRNADGHGINNTEQSFWSRVDPGLVSQLNKDWSYKSDFEMFNYSLLEYFDRLGIPGTIFRNL